MVPTIPVVVNGEGREAVEPAAEEGEPTATAATADVIAGGRARCVRIMYCKK